MELDRVVLEEELLGEGQSSLQGKDDDTDPDLAALPLPELINPLEAPPYHLLLPQLHLLR